MSRATLSIELESAEIFGGEVLQGVVVVRVSEAVVCSDLMLTLGWQTAGRGEVDHDTVETVMPPIGEWAEGGHRVPFSLQAPRGPLSHSGELVEIHWAVTATASLRDEAVTAAVPVVLRAGSPTLEPAPDVPQMPPITTQQRPPGSLLTRLMPTILSVSLALVGGVVVLGGAAALVAVGPIGLGVAVVGMVMIVLGSRGALKASGNAAARRKIKDITIAIHPRSLRPGQAFDVSVGFRPAQDTAVEQVRLRLILRELASTGTGTDRTTHAVDRVFTSAQISGAQDFASDEKFSAEHTLALPPDAPHSFSARSNRLLWLVQLDIDIDDWPDLTEPHPILVS
ncbi:MAG: hypothetical protein ACI8RZ_001742 [Myxococcota bacterium]|jgi:hypothetical protein